MLILLAGALVAGVPTPVLAILTVAMLRPWWFLIGVTGWSFAAASRTRRRRDDVVYLQGVAAELRSGASLRQALVDASGRVPHLDLQAAVRAAVAGRPLREVAGRVAPALGSSGPLFVAAIEVAAVGGGAVAATFDGLAMLASEDAELAGERRAATAQAKVSALIVGGLPIIYLVYALASGKLAALLAFGSVGAGIVGIGVGSLGIGLIAVTVMLRRASRCC